MTCFEINNQSNNYNKCLLLIRIKNKKKNGRDSKKKN